MIIRYRLRRAVTAIDSYDMIQAGNVIRKRRLRMRLTQEQFAELIGISYPHFTQIERGEAGMSIQTMLTVCRVIGVTPNDLLGYTDPPAPVDMLPKALSAAINQCDAEQQESICKMVISFLRLNR